MQSLEEYRQERMAHYLTEGVTPESAELWADEDTAELAQAEAEEREQDFLDNLDH